MARDPKIDVLSSLTLFSAASKRELSELSSLCTETIIAEGRNLTVQGEVGRELVVIISGTADVVRDGTVIATVGAGQHVGEVALFDGTPRTATVVATSEIHAVVFSWLEFREVIARFPELEARLHETVERRRQAARTKAA